ncbi:MAG TPA: GAF domain-containing protein [Methylomirabilota bacterium]|nr:GAF domain-containing protein [Methylomirabilota bacterium]
MGRKKRDSGAVAVSPRKGPGQDRAGRLAFERFLTELSSAFAAVAPAAVDAEIEAWLPRLVELVGADRASIIQQLSLDGTALHLTHSHAVEGVPPFPKVVLDTHYPWYVEQVRQGRTLRLERALHDLPPEAVAERQRARRTGLKSHLMLPFTVAGRPLGALVFASFRAHRTWPDDLVQRLGLVAQMIASALARKREWQALEERLAFERLLAELSSAFVAVAPAAVDAEIEGWLRRLVEFLGVDRAGVSQVSPDGAEVCLTHFYAVEGVPPLPKIALDTQYPWFVEQVRQGRMIRVERLPDKVPPGVSAELDFATRVGLKSHLMLPLTVAGRPMGALAFGCFRAHRSWPDDLVGRLGLVAQVFANALARKQAWQGLQERLAFERFLAELSSAFVAVAPAAVDAEIERWLRRLVELLGVDRSSIAQVSPDGKALQTTHSYAVEGVPPLPMVVLDTQFPWYVEQVRQGRILRFEGPAQNVPPEVAREFDFMTQRGLKSHLILPCAIAGRTLGALGFGCFRAHRSWPDELVQRLGLVAEVFANALARKRAWQALEERLAFERLIADVAKTLVNVPAGELDAQIGEGLTRLIGHLGVDRSWLGRFSGDGAALIITHWVAAAGAQAPPSTDSFRWYVEQLRQGRTVVLSRLPEDLPAEAVGEREFVQQSGVQSHLAVPVLVGERVWGAIGLAAFRQPREWTPEEIGRLRLMGDIMMSALLRQESEEEAHRKREELTHVVRVAALGELTAALAHELNQPLAAIQTNVQATRRLLARGKPPDDLDEVLSDVASDATRAGDLIRRLRDLLRRRELEKVPLDLNQIVRDIESIAHVEVHRHGARLVLELTLEAPGIQGDAVQLQQVLLNLVRNAAEAVAGNQTEGREVVVRTTASPPDQVMVSVEDAGPPIDEATFDGLFIPFHTTKPEGLGMGLAISRSIVEAHGGRLWAERRPGRGLAMRFTLPALTGTRL